MGRDEGITTVTECATLGANYKGLLPWLFDVTLPRPLGSSDLFVWYLRQAETGSLILRH